MIGKSFLTSMKQRNCNTFDLIWPTFLAIIISKYSWRILNNGLNLVAVRIIFNWLNSPFCNSLSFGEKG